MPAHPFRTKRMLDGDSSNSCRLNIASLAKLDSQRPLRGVENSPLNDERNGSICSSFSCSDSFEKTDDEYSDPSILIAGDDSDEDDECIISDFEFPEEFDIPPNTQIIATESHKDAICTMQSEELQNVPVYGEIEKFQGKKIKEYYFYLSDWLFNLSHFYPTTTETLHQTFSLLIKYLMKKIISLNQLQLIGCCCLWICSKLDFHALATLDPLLKYCHNKYTRDDFISIESDILSTLDYKVESITANLMLRHFLAKIDVPSDVSDAATFLCSASLMYLDMASFRPSVIAYASILFSLTILSYNPNSDSNSIAGSAQSLDLSSFTALSPLNEYVSKMSPHDITICLNAFFKCTKFILPNKKFGCVRKLHQTTKSEDLENALIAASGLFKSPTLYFPLFVK